VAEKLRYQEADNPITDLYINLLARAMDGERIGEAHPAFVGIISQLAPDEVVFLAELSRHEYTLILKINDDWPTPSQRQVLERLTCSGMPETLVEKSNEILFKYQKLNQPEMFYLFLEHLYHLGLVQYLNTPSNEGDYKGLERGAKGTPLLIFIGLSRLGKLFHKACVGSQN
jgi:Abortive infection alpha